MPSETNPIDALMARLAAGEREAFTGVFELIWGPLYRLCLSLSKSEADAADAAQEAMCKILQRASDYDPSRPALPWAMAIAAWECRTLARKRTRRREADQPLEERAGDHLEDEILQQDLVSAAARALGELSELDRETLVATFWEEGATATGATLRKRRERALDRLRKTWKRLYGLD
jgi:RNA polymerase sigma-70 factor (ECF subfamily)